MKLANITPITELKRDAAGLVEKATEEGPIVITQNGRATAVLVDIHTYEADRRAFALLQLAQQGESDIAAGRTETRAAYRKRVEALFAEHRAAEAPQKPARKRKAK